MKSFRIEQPFWDLFPDAAVGIVVARDLPASEAEITEEDRAAAARILTESFTAAEEHLVLAEFARNPTVAVWREAYQRFPKKKGARCSFENLLKRVSKGNPVSSINPTVDISNAISLTYGLPIGAENIDAIAGDLRLTAAAGGEDFLPLGEDEQDPPLTGEIAYLDDLGAVCRCLNWRDGQRTAVSEGCTSQVFVMECVDPERIGVLEEAIARLAELLAAHAHARIATQGIATASAPAIELAD